MTDKWVLATVGLCGTGKSEVTGYIAETFGFEMVYFGGRVLDEVKRLGLEINAENEKTVRERMRREEGMSVMAKRSLPKIREILEGSGRVIIDGLYSTSEYTLLGEALGDCFQVVAVHAPKPLRYARMGKRPVRPLTPQQVDQRDQNEIKNLEKSDPIVLADIHLINNTDIPGLRAQIDEALNGLGIHKA